MNNKCWSLPRQKINNWIACSFFILIFQYQHRIREGERSKHWKVRFFLFNPDQSKLILNFPFVLLGWLSCSHLSGPAFHWTFSFLSQSFDLGKCKIFSLIFTTQSSTMNFSVNFHICFIYFLWVLTSYKFPYQSIMQAPTSLLKRGHFTFAKSSFAWGHV